VGLRSAFRSALASPWSPGERDILPLDGRRLGAGQHTAGSCPRAPPGGGGSISSPPLPRGGCWPPALGWSVGGSCGVPRGAASSTRPYPVGPASPGNHQEMAPLKVGQRRSSRMVPGRRRPAPPGNRRSVPKPWLCFCCASSSTSRWYRGRSRRHGRWSRRPPKESARSRCVEAAPQAGAGKSE